MPVIGQILLRLAVAAVFGGLIGVERDLRKRPAGIRTSLFVCMGAALFTVLSGAVSRQFGDTGSTRIASNIVQGIGFLGAGAILREGGSIVGMTTAATIWVEAAIGMAAGAGLYAVSGFSTALVIVALVGIAWCEQRFGLKPRMMTFRITTEHTESIATEVQRLLAELNVTAQHFRVSMAGTKSIVEFGADVSKPKQEALVTRFHREGVVSEVIPSSPRD